MLSCKGQGRGDRRASYKLRRSLVKETRTLINKKEKLIQCGCLKRLCPAPVLPTLVMLAGMRGLHRVSLA